MNISEAKLGQHIELIDEMGNIAGTVVEGLPPWWEDDKTTIEELAKLGVDNYLSDRHLLVDDTNIFNQDRILLFEDDEYA